MKTKTTMIFLVLLFMSCSPIKHSVLTNESKKNDKCRTQIKEGIESILKKYDITYYLSNKELAIIRDSGGISLDFIEEGNSIFYFVLNDPKKPKVTLFRREKGNFTFVKTTKNGIESIEINKCSCNLK